jgi:integrase
LPPVPPWESGIAQICPNVKVAVAVVRPAVLHSLRHAYASLLISNGLNVVFVSRQLGHTNPNITLGVYAHLFGQHDHAQTARDALEQGYAASSKPVTNTRSW